MIREYCYSCDNCSYEFTVWHDWNDLINLNPRCPMCKKIDNVFRNFGSEKIIIDDGVIKTVGALADKNSKIKGIQINGKKDNK